MSYTDNLIDTLTAQEKSDYYYFLKLREEYNKGYYILPSLPSFEEVSKDDVDEEDKWLSLWYLKECQKEYDRVMAKLNKLNYFSDYFYNFEKMQIKILLDSLNLDEKLELKSELESIPECYSFNPVDTNLLLELNRFFKNQKKDAKLHIHSSQF